MSNTPKAAMARPTRGKVVIGYVHPGEVSSYFCTSLLLTMMRDGMHGPAARRIVNVRNEWSSANVSRGRNSIVRAFLDGDTAEWLLMIDADMAWQPEAVDQLLAVADKMVVPIVGGLCFGANEDRLFPTIYAVGMASEDEDAQPTTMRLQNYPDDTLFRCAATGAAFLMVHRDVLTAMRDKQFNTAFPWFQETSIGDQPLSEDLTFCLRAGTILGYPIHVHTGVKIGHHKSTVLTADLFRTQTPPRDDEEATPC